MKITRQKRATALIPTASMADIAFLLIIFFMVTTVYEVDRTSVKLPVAVEYEEAEKGAAIVVLTRIQNLDTGEWELVYKFSDGKEMSKVVPGVDAVYLEASRLAYQDQTLQFLIKADGELKFALIDELMDKLRKAGVSKLLLLTAPTGKAA